MYQIPAPRHADIAAWRSRAANSARGSAELMLRLAAETSTAHGTYIRLIEPAGPPTPGALSGVPFAVKDNIAVAGHPTTGGSAALRRLVLAPSASAVRQLKASGAVVVGKANLHELALGVTSDNGAFGPVRNPRQPGRSAGGSSGGTAAAVASGSVPFALGTDTGGSMTIPAAFCGVVGMRPTHGRYPHDGLLAISPSRDTIGVMANHVADVALVDSILTADPAPGVPTGRLGVPHSGWWDGLAENVQRAAEGALLQLERSGFELVDVDLADIQERALACRHDLVGYEAPRALRCVLTAAGSASVCLEDLIPLTQSADVRAILEHFVSEPVTDARYHSVLQLREVLQQATRTAFLQASVDVLVYPSTPISAVPLGAYGVRLNGRPASLFETATRNTELGSMLGHAMISLPVPVQVGAPPVGLTFEGMPHSDHQLLATTARAEAVLSAQHGATAQATTSRRWT